MVWDRVKVFSATKASDRQTLGERITEWIKQARPQIADTVVRQSSDSAFHCLSITFFYTI